MPFAQFMELALYHPEVGYYQRDRRRVGYDRGTDFYTASTSGPVFGELVVAACLHLLGARDPSTFTFIEIGAESATGVLTDVSQPFFAARALRLGEPLSLTGDCIVFSNELFDAQPCRRFVRTAHGWRELGVALRENTLREVVLDHPVLEEFLPAEAPIGYILDAPRAAAELATHLAAQPWQGLFVAFDYGKSWPELSEATPYGTTRAYFQHTQSNDLLGRPGEQDLTCHICWDWIADALARHGFAAPRIVSQEAFFVEHAAGYLAATMAAEAERLSPRKLSLLQLLHPTHLGQKFQVLSALRG